jgi:hypothetical protein
MFQDFANPFGAAAFEPVAYPMIELQNKKLIRRVKRSLRNGPKKMPSQHLKHFLLTY